MSKSRTPTLIGPRNAANEDRLGETLSLQEAAHHTSIESTRGWDAYEVWRRFIKDARDRRNQQQ